MAFGFDFEKEEDVKKYLENIGIEYRFGCFSEKNPESCHLLGDYFESVKKDFPKAFAVFRANCDDSKHAHSCFKVANYHFLGKGTNKDLEKAFQAYEKACENDNGQACLNSGLMCISKAKELRNRPKDHAKGLQLLMKACELQNSYSCHYLGSLYIEGLSSTVEKNMKTAFDYSLKACDYGNMYACANISQMYQRGEGVDVNIEKAQEFKEKALDMQKVLKDGVPTK